MKIGGFWWMIIELGLYGLSSFILVDKLGWPVWTAIMLFVGANNLMVKRNRYEALKKIAESRKSYYDL